MYIIVVRYLWHEPRKCESRYFRGGGVQELDLVKFTSARPEKKLLGIDFVPLEIGSSTGIMSRQKVRGKLKIPQISGVKQKFSKLQKSISRENVSCSGNLSGPLKKPESPQTWIRTKICPVKLGRNFKFRPRVRGFLAFPRTI